MSIPPCLDISVIEVDAFSKESSVSDKDIVSVRPVPPNPMLLDVEQCSVNERMGELTVAPKITSPP